MNITDSKDVFGPNGLVSKLNVTGNTKSFHAECPSINLLTLPVTHAGFLSGLDGFNLTELDEATLGGPAHYNEMHNSDVSLSKTEFAFGGGKNAESNDTASELGCAHFLGPSLCLWNARSMHTL